MATSPRKPGRPPKLQGPKIPHEEVERLLIEGEVVIGADGTKTRRWPPQREVARRYGVSAGLIGTLAKQRKVAERKAALLSPPAQPRKPKAAPCEPEDDSPAEPEAPRRKPGRPRKAEAPIVPHEELDRLLVLGEVQELEDGATTTVYPSYRELAERYGVGMSYIASYVKSHNCARRRAEAQTRLALRVEDKLIEKRAEAIAVAQEDVVRMVDEFLLSFEKALKEGRVRTDNPTDVNTLVRLKEFVLGGADSRQELHAALSLESIQQRHAAMLREERDAPELTGVVDSTHPRTEVSELDQSNKNRSDDGSAPASVPPPTLSRYVSVRNPEGFEAPPPDKEVCP